MINLAKLSKDPGAIATLAGVLIGSIITGGIFLISYFAIERPKVRLEEKRVAIEAYKQLINLQPNVDFDCNPEIIDFETVDFLCTAKNIGAFGASYTLTSVTLLPMTRTTLPKAGGNDWYRIERPEQRNYVPSGGDSGIRFLAKIDPSKAPANTDFAHLVANIRFSAESDESMYELLTHEFPETLDKLNSMRKVDTVIKMIILPDTENPNRRASSQCGET